MLTSDQRLDAIHRLGRALADPTRCRLLLALVDGPTHPADLAQQLGLTRQNVSNHLSCLRECGLVATASEGRRVRYTLVDARLAHALDDLLGVVWGGATEHQEETTPTHPNRGQPAPTVHEPG
ncbi:metalloregulator ArsR/SmtB family transcription factor [Lipingzhangella sp. LS1_29]|uniref:Metalloregulator ArsR/SmtB family transcription factor n=2 Tax=Lipingzhangella rawalii TaxID=2055835 RepID=A0ABU2HAS5_9ACTN|nr:metalloregulator ArsR/SmtB family transcription factor [Lipingzhangella rawalii]MDS1271974.1 metalloregulator ArsR/SmtB family transcription factor [Lipingzhangella rawalii]